MIFFLPRLKYVCAVSFWHVSFFFCCSNHLRQFDASVSCVHVWIFLFEFFFTLYFGSAGNRLVMYTSQLIVFYEHKFKLIMLVAPAISIDSANKLPRSTGFDTIAIKYMARVLSLRKWSISNQTLWAAEKKKIVFLIGGKSIKWCDFLISNYTGWCRMICIRRFV